MDSPSRAPPDFIKRFYAERIRLDAEQTLTSTTLYEDYCCWCEEQALRPLALPQFGQLFGLLGIAKARLAGRVRYLGLALVRDGQPPLTGASVQSYFSERLRSDPQASLTVHVLYADYTAWAEADQQEPLSLPTFGREIEKLGIKKQRVAGRMRYLGIALAGLDA